MKPNAELRCEKCRRLYARVTPDGGGQTLEVLDGGMRVRAVNKKERVGALACVCGHETLIDLAAIGIP